MSGKHEKPPGRPYAVMLTPSPGDGPTARRVFYTTTPAVLPEVAAAYEEAKTLRELLEIEGGAPGDGAVFIAVKQASERLRHRFPDPTAPVNG